MEEALDNSNSPILVCALADAPLATEGAVFHHQCSRCGRRLMVALSGQRLMLEQKVSLLCLICFVLREPNEKAEIQLPLPVEQLVEEMRTAKPNLRRNRN